VIEIGDDDGDGGGGGGETRICQVCTAIVGADAVTLQPCGAAMCVECVDTWANHSRGRIPMCACKQAQLQADHAVMYVGDVLRVLSADQKASWEAAIVRVGSDTVRECPRCMIKVVTRVDAKVFFCLNINCKPHPGYGYCKTCLGAINDLTGHSCVTEFDHAALLAAAANPANGFVQPCPGCGNAAQKIDGSACNHMTCVCGVRFCGACRFLFVSVNGSYAAAYRHTCTSDNMFRINAEDSVAGVAAAIARARA